MAENLPFSGGWNRFLSRECSHLFRPFGHRNPLNTNVSRYMTQKLVTATEDMSVKQAFLLMQTHRVRHIPVVDGEALVGIISDRDLRRPRWSEGLDDWTSVYQIDDHHQVGQVMTRNPETVRTSDHVLEAVRIFRERRYGALPVLNKHGDLVGILSAQDLLEPLEEALTTKGGKS